MFFFVEKLYSELGGHFLIFFLIYFVSANRTRYAPKQVPIVIQLSNHVLNQIVSRIFAIYLREILGYQNTVQLKELNFLPDTTEEDKIIQTIDDIVR